MKHVIVIGAGAAGTGAAEHLTTAGWQTTVLDQASRAGGRCATRRTAAGAEDTDGPWFDHGAQYFTAREPAFRAAVAPDLEAGRLLRWRPRICAAERVAKRWRLTASPDERERLIGPDGLNRWLGQRLRFCGAKLRCQAQARAVEETAAGWRVALTEGRDPPPAEALIVAVPAPRAAALFAAAADHIPVLAAAERAMRACLTVVVAAPAIADCHGAFVKDGALSWFADNSHKAGQNDAARHLWTLNAGPEFSDQHVDAALAEIAPALVAEFAEITGAEGAAIDVAHSHRWRYARPGGAAPRPENGCYVDPRRGLALAGDWLAGGRVEGAWCSGRAAALALAAKRPSGD